ncbi:glycosyltransferase family 92 domain-containing protein [Ditylenchus destructor]|nr:glycosyltransferase family 92 domain-containing protein [Ditylenchus destructor]
MSYKVLIHIRGTILDTLSTGEGKEKGIDVAVCYSPLYFTEHWELLLAGLHIYRHFGVDLQVFYIQSVGEDIWKTLQLYKERGLIEFEHWPLSKMDQESIAEIGLDPRMELEWRNKPTAYTDCLLKYKEMAQFIIMADLDDIWFPHMGNTFIEEFKLLSSQYPMAAAFYYNRHDVDYLTCNYYNPTASNFSIKSILKSAQVRGVTKHGKTVVNTSRVEGYWVHWAGQVEYGKTVESVPDNLTRLYHFRYESDANETENATEAPLIHNGTFLTTHVNMSHIDSIEEDFAQFKKQSQTHNESFRQLTKSNNYDEQFWIYYRDATPLKANISSISDFECGVFSSKYEKNRLGEETAILLYKFLIRDMAKMGPIVESIVDSTMGFHTCVNTNPKWDPLWNPQWVTEWIHTCVNTNPLQNPFHSPKSIRA